MLPLSCQGGGPLSLCHSSDAPAQSIQGWVAPSRPLQKALLIFSSSFSEENLSHPPPAQPQLTEDLLTQSRSRLLGEGDVQHLGPLP